MSQAHGSFSYTQSFFKKMGQSRPLFCLFLFFSHYNFNTNWKKRRWCAWDSNLGLQNGRRRQNHRAMAATQLHPILKRLLIVGKLRPWVQSYWLENFLYYDSRVILYYCRAIIQRLGTGLGPICGQYYKASMIVIYDSRVVPDLKIPHITILDS